MGVGESLLKILVVTLISTISGGFGREISFAVEQLQYTCPDYSDGELYGDDGLPTFRPLIIGHRGSSGMYPEHTALSYRKAAEQGADLIECDLAVTKDFEFICAHEPWLALTTNIGEIDEFADRKATYNMDDDDEYIDWNDKGDITDWFSFDFTLAELKTLKKHQSQEFRDPRYDGIETVVTIDELVQITRNYSVLQGRTIGIYPELKHSAAINRIWGERGIEKRFEDLALEKLKYLNFNAANSPCYLQSFELTSLEYVRDKTDLKLVFLLERMINDTDWARIDKLNLAGIGFDKTGLVTLGQADDIGRGQYLKETTDFIDQIHAHNLTAVGFTFRNEWMKLFWDHGQDPYSQLSQFLGLGIDGYFTDFPLTVRRFMYYEGILCEPKFDTKSSAGDKFRPLNAVVTILFGLAVLARSQ